MLRNIKQLISSWEDLRKQDTNNLKIIKEIKLKVRKIFKEHNTMNKFGAVLLKI